MPPRVASRFSFAHGLMDEHARRYLTEREPFGFRVLPDTRTHRVVAGDTLFSLAGRYFAPLPRACGLWWVIADFQPDPIVDPTLELELGRTLHIVSNRIVTDVILGEARRREHG